MTASASMTTPAERHRALDALIAGWCRDTGKLPSTGSVTELMEWSHNQTLEADADVPYTPYARHASPWGAWWNALRARWSTGPGAAPRWRVRVAFTSGAVGTVYAGVIASYVSVGQYPLAVCAGLFLGMLILFNRLSFAQLRQFQVELMATRQIDAVLMRTLDLLRVPEGGSSTFVSATPYHAGVCASCQQPVTSENKAIRCTSGHLIHALGDGPGGEYGCLVVEPPHPPRCPICLRRPNAAAPDVAPDAAPEAAA